jgi:hypothetical protein
MECIIEGFNRTYKQNTLVSIEDSRMAHFISQIDGVARCVAINAIRYTVGVLVCDAAPLYGKGYMSWISVTCG